MILKDFIKQLQDHYNSFDDVYKNQRGEPEIMIDVFDTINGGKTYKYSGFGKEIFLDNSRDGVYTILCAFKDVN